MGVTGIIITTRYEAKLLQSQKKNRDWKDIMIVHLKYPVFSQVRGWKQILRETGMCEEKKMGQKADVSQNY